MSADLSKMKVAELRQMAKDLKIQQAYKMKKEELIDAIGSADHSGEEQPDLSVPSMSWSLAQLKEQSKAFKLKVTGSKSDLLDQITKYLRENPAAKVLKVEPKSPKKSPKEKVSPKEKLSKENEPEEEEETLVSSITNWFYAFKSTVNILAGRKLSQEKQEDAIATIQETFLHIKKKKELKDLIHQIDSISEDEADEADEDGFEPDEADE